MRRLTVSAYKLQYYCSTILLTYADRRGTRYEYGLTVLVLVLLVSTVCATTVACTYTTVDHMDQTDRTDLLLYSTFLLLCPPLPPTTSINSYLYIYTEHLTQDLTVATAHKLQVQPNTNTLKPSNPQISTLLSKYKSTTGAHVPCGSSSAAPSPLRQQISSQISQRKPDNTSHSPPVRPSQSPPYPAELRLTTPETAPRGEKGEHMALG
jgi:hypothetical protein